MNLTEEQQKKNFERTMALIETFPEERKLAVKRMFDGPVGTAYFTAPGSSREDYHDCCPGGLVDHSLRVVANIWRLAKDLCPDRWPKHKLAFVGLFHDFGKVGDGEKDRYVPEESQWHRNIGRLYKVNPEMKWMTINDGTIFLLQMHGITLDYEEYISLKLADGQYLDENKPYAMREPPLGLLLHWADLWSSKDVGSKK